MPTEHDELAGAIPALVLGALAADERRQLVVHLEGCSSCRALAARLGKGAAALLLEPEPVEPPATLRGRVLTAVAASHQDAPAVVRRRPLSSLFPRPRPLRLRLGGRRLALAAATAFAFLLGTGLGLGLGRGQPPFWPSNRVPAPEVARFQLHGTGGMVGVSATAVALKRDGLTLIDFRDMPQPPAGKVYELWMISADGTARPAGVFVPDADGARVVLLTRDLDGAKQLAVTVEQAPDGAAVPSQTPQLTGTIA